MARGLSSLVQSPAKTVCRNTELKTLTSRRESWQHNQGRSETISTSQSWTSSLQVSRDFRTCGSLSAAVVPAKSELPTSPLCGIQSLLLRAAGFRQCLGTSRHSTASLALKILAEDASINNQNLWINGRHLCTSESYLTVQSVSLNGDNCGEQHGSTRFLEFFV
jgi:hypothetical protein